MKLRYTFAIAAALMAALVGCSKSDGPSASPSASTSSSSEGSSTGYGAAAVYNFGIKLKPSDYVTQVVQSTGVGSTEKASCEDLAATGSKAASHYETKEYGVMMTSVGFGKCSCTKADEHVYKCKADMYLRPMTTAADGIPYSNVDGKPPVGILN